MAEYQAKYQIDTDENRTFLEEVRNILFSFGQKFPSPGGSAYYLGDDGTPWLDRSHELYETCRMAHVYCLADFLGKKDGKDLAAAAIRGLQGEMKDRKNGGWYNALNPDGTPQDNKLCYAHAFVILAASSAVLADIPGSRELLEEATAVYDKYYWNEEEGMSADTWNTEFTVLDDYRGLNANMHSVEAFMAASDVTGDETYRARAGRIIDRVSKWAEGNNWRIPEHFSKDWAVDLERNKENPADQFKPYGATPGHGIEWSRLITQYGLSTYKNDRKAAQKYIDIAENLYNRAVSDGWDADGAPGIVYTTDWNGKPVVHDRMHWTLAEAINTSAVLYRTTGKQIYAEHFARYMKYLDECVLDHVNGSWFHQLDSSNHMIDTVWPGKPDLYHAVQATLIPYYAADLSIAPAVKNRAAV